MASGGVRDFDGLTVFERIPSEGLDPVAASYSGPGVQDVVVVITLAKE